MWKWLLDNIPGVSFIKNSWVWLLIIAAVLVYHFVDRADIQEDLSKERIKTSEQLVQLNQLRTNETTLVDANKQLQVEMSRRLNDLLAAQAETRELAATALLHQERLSLAQAKLDEFGRKERERALLHSKKGQLLLNIYNRNVACTVKHYAQDGRCVAGKWVPNAR